MPLAEIIGETLGRVVAEFLLDVVAYWTGYVFLKFATFGSVEIAPALSCGEKNEGKAKWYQIDWSIWLRVGGRQKPLKLK